MEEDTEKLEIEDLTLLCKPRRLLVDDGMLFAVLVQKLLSDPENICRLIRFRKFLGVPDKDLDEDTRLQLSIVAASFDLEGEATAKDAVFAQVHLEVLADLLANTDTIQGLSDCLFPEATETVESAIHKADKEVEELKNFKLVSVCHHMCDGYHVELLFSEEKKSDPAAYVVVEVNGDLDRWWEAPAGEQLPNATVLEILGWAAKIRCGKYELTHPHPKFNPSNN